jgi:hypothetical protein
MKRAIHVASLFALLTAGLFLLDLGGDGRSPRAAAQATREQRPKPEPVEPDMHEFMEYLFQPTYVRLKGAMEEEPEDDDGATWGTVKSGALILAEGGNLIMLRGPEEERGAWDTHAAAVRSAGGQLYRAAKEKDFDAATAHYEVMLTACNACHDEFADGEHQLSP